MAKKKKYVLAVVGSPRKHGNCDLLCERVMAGAKSMGARVETVYLHEMNLKPCCACQVCQKKATGVCAIDDDMEALYPKLKACDALVIASPIYWMTVSAQTKLFMDRCYPFAADKGPRMGAKKVVACLTYGAPDVLTSGCDNAARTLSDMFTFLKIPLRFVHASAWQKGDIKSNRAVLSEAFKAGKEAVT